MLRLLRIGTSAIALSAFVAAPAMVVVTAGPVEAQQGNGNGNGNAGGTGQGTNGNGNAFGHGGNSANGGFSHGDNGNGNHGNGNNGNGNGNGNGNNGNGNAYGHNKDRSSQATGGNIKSAGGGNNNGGGGSSEANGGFSGPDPSTGGALSVAPTTGSLPQGGSTRASTAPRTTALARVLETLFGAPAPSPTETTAQNNIGSTARAPAARTRAARTRSAPAIEASIKPAPRPTIKGAMHPANLGTVTGVINASTKAKLDRIASGNFNGPAGLAAALAIADFTMQALQEDLDIAKETLALAAAYDLVRNAPTQTEIANAQSLLENGIDDKILDDQARSTLGYPDLGPANQVIAAARAAGTDQPGTAALTRAAVVVNRLVDARTAITQAEERILSAYSGALDAAPETAEQVIEAVRLANPTREEIKATLPGPDSLTADNERAPPSPAERRLINSVAGRFGNS